MNYEKLKQDLTNYINENLDIKLQYIELFQNNAITLLIKIMYNKGDFNYYGFLLGIDCEEIEYKGIKYDEVLNYIIQSFEGSVKNERNKIK